MGNAIKICSDGGFRATDELLSLSLISSSLTWIWL